MLAVADQAIAEESETLDSLAATFGAAGRRLYLVDGSVRDTLLGRLDVDLDFTTDARPEMTRAILNDWADIVWNTGIGSGTLSAERHDRQMEITTFRADTYGRVSRSPEVTFGDTLEGDLVRRDFHCNPIAVEFHSDGIRTFLDPLGGFEDLVAGVLDTPGTPEIDFGDDPLQMLRACCFTSQLEFDAAPCVLRALKEMPNEVDRVTVERISTKLSKLILGADPSQGIDLMMESGLADHVLLEVSDIRMTQDEHRQRKDIYQHSLQVIRQAIDQEEPGEPNLVLRWAALLYDCGKPATRAYNEQGNIIFYQYEVVGAKLVRRRLRKLEFPEKTNHEISQLVYLHMRFHGCGEGRWTGSTVRHHVNDAGDSLGRLNKTVRTGCTTRNRREAAHLTQACDSLETRIKELAEQEDFARVRPDLDGNETMGIPDLKPGKEVRRAWNYLKGLRLESGLLEREDAILALKKWWYEQSGGRTESENES